MGVPFSDITLYTPSSNTVGTLEYIEEVSLQNFVSDLYVQNMNGYKPPKTTRITIQPAFHGVWDKPWKNGSIVAIAPFFCFDTYCRLDKKGKFKYTLDLIQSATLSLSDEYGWDKTVFQNAYQKVLESDFVFKIDCAPKQSRDKKKTGNLIIEKTEPITSVYINIQNSNSSIKRKLFDKKNQWWYDCIYILARHTKWLDKERFGISYEKGKIEALYSLEKDEVELFENGCRVSEIDFSKYFIFN
jgi:hypothetical protein